MSTDTKLDEITPVRTSWKGIGQDDDLVRVRRIYSPLLMSDDEQGGLRETRRLTEEDIDDARHVANMADRIRVAGTGEEDRGLNNAAKILYNEIFNCPTNSGGRPNINGEDIANFAKFVVECAALCDTHGIKYRAESAVNQGVQPETLQVGQMAPGESS